MNGNKISDCIVILSKLLIPNTILSNADRQELLNFFVEEKVKSIKIYESTLLDKAQKVLSQIETKKGVLVKKQQYEDITRIRDLEKSYKNAVQILEEFKRKNLSASFGYSSDGLSLFIADGEYPYTIQELEKMGLHLIFFSQTLAKIKL